MRRQAAALVLLFLLAATPMADAQSPTITVGPIGAQLAPPFTHYNVTATSSTGATLTYTWSNTNTCGKFTSAGPKADWDHGDTTNCGHDTTSHPARIKVSVTDGTRTVVRYYYDGSNSGSGSAPGMHTRCGATGVSGELEPAQGAWQDDDVIPDKVGKKLLKTSDTRYTAELDMVKGRDTAIYGIRGARGTIELRGLLEGTVLAPALVRITVKDQAGNEIALHEESAGELPIEGACTGTQGFRKTIQAPTGVPAQAFRFAQAGTYTITMELAEEGGGVVPGTQVVVDGYVREVPGLRVVFVPLTVQRTSSADLDALGAAAAALARDLSAHASDYYPVAPGAVRGTSAGLLTFERQYEASLARCQGRRDPANWTLDECRGQVTSTAIERSLGAALARSGAQRAVAVASPADFVLFGVPDAVAFTGTTKVTFSQTTNDHWDVAHELAHTLPRYPWSDAQMLAACGVDFHNTGLFGNGGQLVSVASPARQIHEKVGGLMGPAKADKHYWIEQCTYWHLQRALQRPADPPLVMASGTIERWSGGEVVDLGDALTFDGEPDLDENVTGPYAVVLRDASDAVLSRDAFDAEFRTDGGVPRRIVSFAHSVPRHPDARWVAIEKDGVELARTPLAAQAPAVGLAVASSSREEGARLTWTGEGNATVLLSADGGETFSPVAVEVSEKEHLVPPRAFNETGSYVARVVLSASGASAEEDAPFTISALAPPTPTATATATSAPSTAPPETDGAPGLAVGLVVACVALVALLRGARR